MNKNNRDCPSALIATQKLGRWFSTLAAHPYLCALAVCLLINPFYLGAEGNIPDNTLFLETLAVWAVGAFLLYRALRERGAWKKCVPVAVAAWLVCVLIGARLYGQSHYQGIWMLVGGSVIVLLLYGLTWHAKQYRTQSTSLLILAVGFLLKFYYVLETSVYTRQHDVGTFDGSVGHAGYIHYFLQNHSLPNFDPRGYWQFYHPPLHHILCAAWVDISTQIFGIEQNAAQESIQTLTLFYSMVIMITAYRILRHFRLHGIALYAPLLLISFHPAFILFSGSINNDVLSVAFLMGAVLCTLKWYETPHWQGIIKIALCVGLGMMTKLSAALVAPPIAIVFVVVLVKKLRAKEWNIFGQFAAFAAVCMPLGLWSPLRNLIRFDVPVNYVQEMDPSMAQYVGDQSFLSRITDFSAVQFQSVFEQFAQRDDTGAISGRNENNPLVALLKNFLFGEYIGEANFPDVMNAIKLPQIFFWVGVIVAAMAFVSMIIMCCRKDSMQPMQKVFLISFYAVLLGTFYQLSASSPFVCSMNSRYITPTMLIGALFYGVCMQKLSASEKIGAMIAVRWMSIMAVLFALLSTLIYVGVGMPLAVS